MAQNPVSSFSDELSNAVNAFGVHLYQTLTPRREGKNMFFSPYSISNAMGMTQLGARGVTAEQIAQVFQFNKIDNDQLHQAFKELNKFLYHEEITPSTWNPSSWRPIHYQYVTTANKLYGKSGFPFLQSFIEDTARFYDSGIEAVDDFTSPVAIKSINDWVSEQTAGKINNLLNPGALDHLTRLLLINAIYFKASWSERFSNRYTSKDFFELGGCREKITADFMRTESTYGFVLDKENRCKVLNMYFEEIQVSMMIALPDDVDGLSELESKLSARVVQGWTEKLTKEYKKVDVCIPKFTIREQLELKESLKVMGVTDAFDEDEADFTGITGSRDLHLSALIHKTFVDINEEGCEAAAVTNVWMMRFGATFNPEEPVEFLANHPFLFIILHNPTKTILFIGRLVDPR